MNDELKKYVKYKISISKIKEEEDKFMSKKRKSFMNMRVGISACACLVLITGGVFAKDIENFIKDKFYLGKGVQTAVDNGYIEHIDNDYTISSVSVTKEDQQSILDTFDVGIKINDFMMTDTNLSIEFETKFDEKINQYKDLSKKINGNTDFESFGYLELTDLFILDDENKLIYSSLNTEYFDNFCKEHNLDYEYQNYNENYLFSTAQSTVTEIDGTTNTVKFVYNISSDEILTSHHLTIYFNKMKFSSKPNFENINNNFTLTGIWSFNLDVPEFMYNHEDIFYKIVSCERSDFNVYEAKATDTGFEIGIMVSNVEKPAMPEKLAIRDAEIMERGGVYYSSRDEFIELYGGEEYAIMYEDYYNKLYPISTNGYHYYSWGKLTEGCYIKNSAGGIFKCAKNIGRKAYANFTDDNKYDYYNTFEMTKYDTTDSITVVIDYYGEPVRIELERR